MSSDDQITSIDPEEGADRPDSMDSPVEDKEIAEALEDEGASEVLESDDAPEAPEDDSASSDGESDSEPSENDPEVDGSEMEPEGGDGEESPDESDASDDEMDEFPDSDDGDDKDEAVASDGSDDGEPDAGTTDDGSASGDSDEDPGEEAPAEEAPAEEAPAEDTPAEESPADGESDEEAPGEGRESDDSPDGSGAAKLAPGPKDAIASISAKASDFGRAVREKSAPVVDAGRAWSREHFGASLALGLAGAALVIALAFWIASMVLFSDVDSRIKDDRRIPGDEIPVVENAELPAMGMRFRSMALDGYPAVTVNMVLSTTSEDGLPELAAESFTLEESDDAGATASPDISGFTYDQASGSCQIAYAADTESLGAVRTVDISLDPDSGYRGGISVSYTVPGA